MPQKTCDYPRPYPGFDTRLELVGGDLAMLCALLPKRSRFLDLGCGHGTEALYLARMGHSVTAVDKDARALEELERRRKAMKLPKERLSVVRTTSSRLDLELEAFDAVVDRLLFHNLRRPQRADMIRLVARALKPGGRWIIRSRSDDLRSVADPYRMSFANYWDSHLARQAQRFFTLGPAVPFAGIFTPEVDSSPGILMIQPAGMWVMTAIRKPRAGR